MAVMQPSWNISLSINLYHCYVTGIHATRSTTIKELHSFLGRNAGIFRGRKNYKPLNFFPFSFTRCFEKKKKNIFFGNIYPLSLRILRIEVKKIEKETGRIFVRIYILEKRLKENDFSIIINLL